MRPHRATAVQHPASRHGPPRVRRATVADLPVVHELRLALLREHAANPIYSRLRPEAPAIARRIYRAQLRAPGELTLLAEQAERVVGVLRCLDTPGSPLLEPERYGYIASVYVRPEARRTGVLRAMLAAAERWCHRRGLTELRLHNAVENDHANGSWSSLGFEVVEVVRYRRLTPR